MIFTKFGNFFYISYKEDAAYFGYVISTKYQKVGVMKIPEEFIEDYLIVEMDYI